MAIPPVKKYSTAIFAYTPPLLATNAEPSKDPQAVQAALSQLIHSVREELDQRFARSHLNSNKSNVRLQSVACQRTQGN